MKGKIRHNSFKNSLHPIITSHYPIDIVNDYFGIALKANFCEPVPKTPANSLPEYKQFNHHRVINARQLNPNSHQNLPGWGHKHHPS
ncbi:unnamed protein product [Linum trigynum]|uniref:Uncharacterized protein n=1 Tax=Linum trigynum TaxID=586398 RepID=A0AAV2DDG0_9ROSI